MLIGVRKTAQISCKEGRKTAKNAGSRCDVEATSLPGPARSKIVPDGPKRAKSRLHVLCAMCYLEDARGALCPKGGPNKQLNRAAGEPQGRTSPTAQVPNRITELENTGDQLRGGETAHLPSVTRRPT